MMFDAMDAHWIHTRLIERDGLHHVYALNMIQYVLRMILYALSNTWYVCAPKPINNTLNNTEYD